MTLRVVWAMNVAPPYRLPVWEALSNLVDLEIWLLSANEDNRRWSVPCANAYGVRLLHTVGFRRKDAVHYVLTQPERLTRLTSDVIILPGWDSPAAWQLRLWAKRRSVSTLAFNESTLESHRHREGLADLSRGWFFRHTDGVLTVSPGSTEAVLARGVPSNRVRQIVNAVDVPRIRQGVSRAIRPRKIGPHTFLFAGQLIERKRPDLVVEALTELPGDCRLVIAGEGPGALGLRDLVRRLGFHERVEFLGYVEPSDLPEILGRCCTLVLPSREEVYGLVVTEALAAGLHVVVSECAGVANVVRGMQGTWVVSPRLEPLVAAMRASAEAWSGPIVSPAALGHAPHIMAASIAEAAKTAMNSRRGSGKNPW